MSMSPISTLNGLCFTALNEERRAPLDILASVAAIMPQLKQSRDLVEESWDTRNTTPTKRQKISLLDIPQPSSSSSRLRSARPLRVSTGRLLYTGSNRAVRNNSNVTGSGSALGSAGSAQRVRGKVNLSMEERIEFLSADDDVLMFSKNNAWCRGCRQIIALDSRHDYYLDAWKKHKGNCKLLVGDNRDRENIIPKMKKHSHNNLFDQWRAELKRSHKGRRVKFNLNCETFSYVSTFRTT